MSGNLFSEFEKSNKDVWRKQAEKEIKQAVSEIMSLKRDGLDHIDPYQTAENLDLLLLKDLQNSQKKNPAWLNIPVITIKEPWIANADIKTALDNGAHGIYIKTSSLSIAKCEFSKVLHNVRLSENPVYFESSENVADLFNVISKGAGYYIKGGIAHDPVANWMRTGQSHLQCIPGIVEVFEKTKSMKEFHPLMVEGHVYHNSGANPVQELAFIISNLVYYLDILTDAGISPLLALNHLFFSVSVGTSHLTEIAKLRALRFLHKKIGRAYEIPGELCNAFVHACTSSFYQTGQVPYNNLVRATLEAMSAVNGGCNALSVRPYNHGFAEPDPFADRLARNLSLLISNESYLNQVADPAAGSYFLESLSLQLADAAWELFLIMEQKGGIVKCFEQGFIQDEIENSWNEKLRSMETDRVVIGVNKYVSGKPASDLNSGKLNTNGEMNSAIRTLPDRNLARHWTKKSGL